MSPRTEQLQPITIGKMDATDDEVIGEWWFRQDESGVHEIRLDGADGGRGGVVEVRMTVVASSGIKCLEIKPRHPIVTTVTSRLLRALPLGEMERAVRRRMEQTPHWPRTREHFRSWSPERPGRKGRSDVEYARIAAQYVDMLRTAEPTKTLAGELFLSTSQLRNVLYEARRRGLLTAAPRGRAGGTLTDKTVRLLNPKERKK